MDGLQRLGFTKISTAEDTNDGLSKIAMFLGTGTPVQVVLSDLNMPGPNGLEFLKKVRTDSKTKSLPFILITTESEKGAVIEAALNGVSGYVVKPFNIETLAKRLAEVYKKTSSAA